MSNAAARDSHATEKMPQTRKSWKLNQNTLAEGRDAWGPSLAPTTAHLRKNIHKNTALYRTAKLTIVYKTR